MNYITQFFSSILSGVPNFILAILLLILALIASSICKSLVMKACKKLGLSKHFSKLGITDEKSSNDFIETIGKIAYIVVLILFLPGILENLNLKGVSTPILAMMTKLLSYLPNILGAIIIFVLGNFISKIIKQILITLINKINLEKLEEKSGVKLNLDSNSIANLIGNIVYVLILIPFIIAALQILNISAITNPAISMLDTIFSMIPNIIVGIVLLFIGVFIGKTLGGISTSISSSLGVDKLMSTFVKEGKTTKFTISSLIGEIVKWIIIIILSVQSFNILNLDVLNSVGNVIIFYLPFLLSATIILGVGFFFASWVENTLQKYTSISKFTAMLIKYSLIVVTIFMTLNQLGIAPFIVNTAFIIILGAFAISFAIAFGIGGKNFASSILNKIEKKIDKKEEDKNE